VGEVSRNFKTFSGRGVRAEVDGRKILVGSQNWLAELGISTEKLTADLRRVQNEGKTVLLVAEETADGERTLLGVIAVADTLKEDAIETVARIKAAGLRPLMLTGDNVRTAGVIAAAVGIEQVLAEVLPGEKAAQVRQLQQAGERVAMVGDGINDAPALMQADIGIAIGAGTDIAIESSDIILVGERLGEVVDAYFIGRSAYRKTVQNLLLAFAFNGIGVPLAVTGLVHPAWAMIAMVLSVSTVLLNSFGGLLLPGTVTRRAPAPVR